MKFPKDYDLFHPSFSEWEHRSSEIPEQLLTAMPELTFNGAIQIQQQSLSFYPGTKLVLYRHPEWKPNNLFVYTLQKNDDVVWLNGSSPGIHEFNSAGNLVLAENNVLDYLHFFCFFVHGPEGPFYLIRSINGSYLPDCLLETEEKAIGSHRDMFLRRFQSPRYFGTSSEGSHRLSTLVMHSNAVFLADFEVLVSGMIEMKTDFPILPDLPAKISAPLAPTDAE